MDTLPTDLDDVAAAATSVGAMHHGAVIDLESGASEPPISGESQDCIAVSPPVFLRLVLELCLLMKSVADLFYNYLLLSGP